MTHTEWTVVAMYTALLIVALVCMGAGLIEMYLKSPTHRRRKREARRTRRIKARGW